MGFEAIFQGSGRHDRYDVTSFRRRPTPQKSKAVSHPSFGPRPTTTLTTGLGMKEMMMYYCVP
jgi:hypothetical protein